MFINRPEIQPAHAARGKAPKHGTLLGRGIGNPEETLTLKKEHLVATLLFVIAFVFYSVAWRTAPVMTLDGPSYMRLAQEIRDLSLHELSLRTPGLPLLMILTGSADHPSRWFFYVSLSLHVLSVAMMAYLLRRLGISARLVLLFTLFGLLPPFVEPAAYVASEAASQFTIVLVFTAVVLWLMEPRWIWFVIASLALPLAAQVRPAYELFPLALIGCLAVGYACGLFPKVTRRKLILIAAVPALLSFAAQAVWSGINYLNFGYYGTSRMLPIALSTKSGDVLEFLPAQYGELKTILIPYRDQNLTEPFGDHRGEEYIYRAMPEILRHFGGDLTAATVNLKAAFIYLVEHKPMSFVGNGLRSFGLFVMPNECELCGSNGLSRSLTAMLQIGLELVFLLQSVALIGMGLIYAPLRMISRVGLSSPNPDSGGYIREWAFGFGVVIVVYTAVVSCFMGIGISRYRQTVDLLMIALCVVACTVWRDILKRASGRPSSID